MTSTLPRETLDDIALRQLAEEPRRSLFPLLNRAEAMVPLVVVLAFLPALYAVDHRTLSDAGAWEGLSALRCLAAKNLAEFVDPAGRDLDHPYRFQPPLMTWVTALGMKLIGVERVAGVVAPAYLCTCGLIIAGYVLGRRFGGEQLGLVAAVLMAFNPQIAAGAQEPVPQSVACLLAVLCLAGVVAHWQRSSGVTSYQLLLGGIALGLCLLAGGPLAVAVVLVVFSYAACWKLDAWVRGDTKVGGEKSQFNRRTAIRSTAVLAATGFALGGWSVLYMSSLYGLDFWNGWLTGGSGHGDARPGAGPERLLGVFLEMNQLIRPLFGLALVGIFGIVRDCYRAEDDPARHHRILLLVWIAVALLCWLVCRDAVDAESPSFKMWETFLTIPLVMAAALGLIDIAERRIGFLPAMAFGGLALTDAVLLADQWLSRHETEMVVSTVPGLRLPGQEAFIVALVLVAGIWLAHYSRGRDARRRVVLTGMLAAIVVGNCLWGALAVRRTTPGDRELEEIRSGFARLPRMSLCTFIGLAPPGRSLELRPPPELEFVLGSVWPTADMNYAHSWEDAVEQSLAETKLDADLMPVFVVWSPRGRIRSAAPAGNLRSAAPPFLYRDFEITAYIREPAVQSSPGVTID